ncbi:hypothetical protein [Lewinella sp. IMCC34183]|uniref:hypothetical protein n=1 Tax=Lewinella sp. IMCC34183 TaxID=2248762 RepID=UPI000E2776FF|nr:hypothetical protein [Lewinella sp. IMCC34183]
MRFFFLLFFAPLLLGLTSCDPGQETTVGDDLLLGTWHLESYTATGSTVSSYQGMEYRADYTLQTIQPTEYSFVFLSATELRAEGSMTQSVTTTFNGQTSTEEVSVSGASMTGPYERVGSRIEIRNNQGGTSLLQIVALDETDLVLDFVYTHEIEANGAPQRQEQTGTYILTRIN